MNRVVLFKQNVCVGVLMWFHDDIIWKVKGSPKLIAAILVGFLLQTGNVNLKVVLE